MTELSRMVVVAKGASLLVVCIVLGACHSRCHVDSGAVFRLGLFPFAGLQHQERSGGKNASVAPTSRTKRDLPWD